jgi:hypothetical protein
MAGDASRAPRDAVDATRDALTALITSANKGLGFETARLNVTGQSLIVDGGGVLV